MWNNILTSFKIDYTYKTNAFIYKWRRFPLLKYILPNTLYAKEGLKSFVRILRIIFSTIWAFVGKFIYIGLMIFLPAKLYANDSTIFSNFLTIFIFLSIAGALTNINIMKASSQKYYCVNLMHMDAKNYELSYYIFTLLKFFITFLPALMLFVGLCQVNVLIALLLDALLIAFKIMGDALDVIYYNKKARVLSENSKYAITIFSICLLLAYGLPFISFTLSSIVLFALLPFAILGALFCFSFLWKNTTYKSIYKNVFTLNKILFNVNAAVKEQQREQVKIDDKDIVLDKKIQNKSGYEYFNAIFFERHKRLLLKSAKNFAYVFLAITFVAIGFTIFNDTFKERVNQLIMTSLPYFVFIMYLSNRGSVITQAMFFNCDHSMLAYKFFKQPNVILRVFMTRLKTLIKVNLLPALVLAIALPVVLFLSGGTTHTLVYISLFLSILFMSIFFSVHHLVIYYLLQPYDINMESKSSLFSMANMLTYLACYFCIRIKVDTTLFSIGTILATTVYIVIALWLVYRFAYKTFKLK